MCAANTVRNIVAATACLCRLVFYRTYIVSESNGRLALTDVCAQANKRLKYSCFEKGCPTKPYATIPKGIMGNGGLWYLTEALGISTT